MENSSPCDRQLRDGHGRNFKQVLASMTAMHQWAGATHLLGFSLSQLAHRSHLIES